MALWALGLDPSLTHSALVLGVGDPDKKKIKDLMTYRIKVELKSFPHEIARLGAITERLLAVFEDVEAAVGGPGVLCIENYSYGSQQSRGVRLGEFGGQVRLHAWSRGWTTVAVPPSTLKKYVTGNGHAEKSLMMQQLLKRWGYEATDDNNADAYALMRVGLHFAAQLHGATVSEELRQLFRKCDVYTPIERSA